MGMCKKCSKGCGAVVLIVGILFLLQDVGSWSFWGISWYTAAFILFGAGALGKAGCKCCNKCCKSDGKSGKKK